MSRRRTMACLGILAGTALTTPALAQSLTPQQVQQQLDLLQKQQNDTQKTIQQLEAQLGTPNTPPPAGGIQIGAVNLKFGGFIAAEGVYRSRNIVNDINTDFAGIPFKNTVQANESEIHGTARQTRVSGLVTGDVDAYTHLAAYVETDFLSAGVTSNDRESNSYTLRIRHGYATVDMDGMGFHFLAGQTWSLLTTNTSGIIPRSEQIPLTIDAQYVPGFTWKRQAQARFVENFGNGIWAGLSVENPENNLAAGTPNPGTGLAVGSPNASNTGDAAGLFNNSTTYSNGIAPDIVGKIAVDPGFGHYELKGVARTFSARDLGVTHVVWGYGVGAAATVPVVPKLIDVQFSGMIGQGIGTYGSGQLADAALTRTGTAITPVGSAHALLGVIAHPTPSTDAYVYGGFEHAEKAGTYGIGNLNNSGCEIEGSAACAAPTKNLYQVTGGLWQNLFKGNFGRVAAGAQYSWTQRQAFNTAGGGVSTAASVAENTVMVSFRYYPF